MPEVAGSGRSESFRSHGAVTASVRTGDGFGDVVFDIVTSEENRSGGVVAGSVGLEDVSA